MKKDTAVQENYIIEVLSSLPGSIYWKDLEGKYLGGNEYAAKMAGLDSVEMLIGKTDYDIFSKAQADQFRNHDLMVIQKDKELNWEELSISPIDGRSFVQFSTKKPLKNKKKEIIGVICNTVDISELKKAQKELQVAKLKAEEASELKSQFMMNMQHDLRTPASGIAAMLEIFAKDEQDPKRKKTLDKLANSSRKLLNILNAILEFDSIKKGTLPVLFEKFNLNNMIHDVKALEFPTANLKHLEIKTYIDARIPQEVIGDAFRLQRILINLLSNAIKFTPQGYIEIDEILWKQIDDKNILVQIIVKDTGIGIPKDKQQVIFERFTRLDPSNKGVYSGLGLGLSMVKQFVEEMNGSIEVNSDPGHGSTFICTLPFKLPDIAERSTETMHKASDLMMPEASSNTEKILIKILLVEDDEIAQLISRSLLVDEFHAQLDVVTTGQEAVNLVKKSEQLYDLILMDLGLPDGNGCEFTKQIHAISKETKKIPIVALTAHDNDEARQECRDYGMQDYLTKPLGVSKMEHIFQKWLHQTIKHKKEAKS